MIAGILKHQWKLMLTLVLVSMLAAAAYTWFKKPEYLSESTALPSSIYSNDRSRLFNENIQILYSELGTADELDVIAGSGQLDTVYLAVTDQFNLFDHYRSSEPSAREKAAEILRSKSKVIKSGNGELKVRVWDTDKDLAPQLANAVMDQLQRIHTDARNAGNEHMIGRLRMKLDSSLKQDSLHPEEGSKEKLRSLRKLVEEYELIAETKTPALVVIEKARPALRADRPRSIPILLAAFILSFSVALLIAAYRQRIQSA